MIARPEYDEFFDEDGNLIGQENEEAVNMQPAEDAATEAEAEPETTAETEPTAENPENEDRAAAEEKKEIRQAAAKEKTENEEKVKKTNTKKTAKADAKEAYHMDEIEARLLEKEKILDKKIQQVEAERQKLQQREAEITDQMERMKELRKDFESMMEVKQLRVTDRQKRRMELLHSILKLHTRTIDELAKRKPYGLMSLKQIRTVNEILDEIRSKVANTDAEDVLHLAEEPRMDDLENHPGTTYSEMALILSAYQHISSLYTLGRLYMKDSADEGEIDGSTNE